MALVEHKHGSLMHAHEGGAGLHWHGEDEIGREQVEWSHQLGGTQLDRIEASLTRLHDRLDQAETLLHERAEQFGPMMRMFAKALGANGNGGR